MFCIPLKDCFLEPKFLFLPYHPQARRELYINLEKHFMLYFHVSMSHFVVVILWSKLRINRRKYDSSKISKILLVSSGDKVNLIYKNLSHKYLQISIFCYYYFAIIFQYFDIKNVLLGQNSFE